MQISQIDSYDGGNPNKGYRGPTKYMDHNIYAWNHPTSVANIALETVTHTYMFGIQVLAPPGHGKTKFATCIAHHVHEVNPDYDIIWAGAHEFTHQEPFFQGLSKKPHIIIFDDITGALKQMSGKEIEANFEALTKVRWYLDPTEGKIPVIIITTSHYSKNMEKEIRNQLGMVVFCGFGIEEQSNIDTFAKKGTKAYSTLETYGRVSDMMFRSHEFHLPIPGNPKNMFKTDNPFRCACMLSYSEAQMIVFSDKDCCEKCVKSQYKKYLAPEVVFEKIRTFLTNQKSNRAWVEALELALVKRGFMFILSKDAAAVTDFIEQDLFTNFSTDYNRLVELYWKEYKKNTPPTKIYHRRKRADEVLTELESLATRIPIGENTPDSEIPSIPINPDDMFGENPQAEPPNKEDN